ncbi:MAG: SGNH/GDSL hydrolase family protein [Longimicrobiales bacterium]
MEAAPTAVEMASPWRRVAKTTLYVLFLCVVSVIGLELTLRVFSLASPGAGFTVTQVEFSRIPGLFSPNQSYVDQTNPALPHQVTIDSLGYRGRDFSRAKSANEIRIILTGDSFTFGSYVDDDETLSAQLQAVLTDACGSTVRTVNAGVPGTTIRGQAEMLRRAFPLDPDLVVLVFHDNDFVNLMNGPMWDVFAQGRAMKSRFPLSIVYPVLRRTALWNLSLEVRRRWLTRGWVEASETDATGLARPSTHTDPVTETRYAEHLKALSEAAKEASVPLLLVAYPRTTSQVTSEEEPRVGTRAIRIAENVGVPAFDLYPSIWNSGIPPEDLSLLPYDGHPSPAGHAFAAKVLADHVASLPEIQLKCRGSAGPQSAPTG